MGILWDSWFPGIVNMSLTASLVIGCVLAARLALKKASKIFSYALWAVVLFRLLCPVSFSTGFSLLKLVDAPVVAAEHHTTTVVYVPREYGDMESSGEGTAQPDTPPREEEEGALPAQTQLSRIERVRKPAAFVWLAGCLIMAAYAAASLIRLRRRLVGAVHLRGEVYLADHIDMPFVMGIFRPKIYLPSFLTRKERAYILCHERQHIRRGDHIFKGLAFLALSLHWFNPLVWLSFHLAGKDMEMSCDEAVLKRMGPEVGADYSQSLLRLASRRKRFAPSPLAFGGGDPKRRIQNLLSWKRPGVWVTAAGTAVCLILGIFCLGNPAPESTPAEEILATRETTGPQYPVRTLGEVGQGEYGQCGDMACYMESAIQGYTFRDMDEDRREEILAEYGDLLDNHTLIARETKQHTYSYILAVYNGASEDAPLWRAYAVEGGYRLAVYSREKLERLQTAVLRTAPEMEYRIENSQTTLWDSGRVLLIQPNDADKSMENVYTQYRNIAIQSEYTQDAASRGIVLGNCEEPYLEVSLISERFGQIREKISLTQEEAEGMRSAELQQLPEGVGFCAALKAGGEEIYWTEGTGVPRQALDLAVERCGYRLESSQVITSPIVEATLDCGLAGGPIRAPEDRLDELTEILQGAKFDYYSVNSKSL